MALPTAVVVGDVDARTKALPPSLISPAILLAPSRFLSNTPTLRAVAREAPADGAADRAAAAGDDDVLAVQVHAWRAPHRGE